MIVLDTHAWIWWTIDPDRLSEAQRQAIAASEGDRIGVSAFSCWEVAKLCEYGRLELPVEVSEWFRLAFQYPGVSLLELTPEIAVESTKLPGRFHRDPADQVIVATARVHRSALVTSDVKMATYPHVQTVE
ncbi:MAG: type II toxin-antitoxin system VapC family toxin [Chloroflexota bacterium]|nr:type II toxin-antitoxin system VapC family toxin [Chloroflexota bacterium]